MITLEQWMKTVDYRITEGSEWNGYSPTAYCLSSWNGENGEGGWSLNVVLDTQTQVVYEVEVCDYQRERAYRLINPDYKAVYRDGLDPEYVDQAWDDVKFTDLEAEEDWLEKAGAIVRGEDYDERVSIPVEFTDEELLFHMKLAHKWDITFNQYIEKVLRVAIEAYERDPEKVLAETKKWKEQQLKSKNDAT